MTRVRECVAMVELVCGSLGPVVSGVAQRGGAQWSGKANSWTDKKLSECYYQLLDKSDEMSNLVGIYIY